MSQTKKIRRRWLVVAVPVAGFLAVFGFLRFVLQPWAEIYALAEMQAFVSDKTPFDMAAKSFDISWIPLKASLTEVRFRAKNPKDVGFEMLSAEEAEVRVDVLAFLGGRLGLSMAGVTGLKLNLDLDPLMKGDGPTPDIPWDMIFKTMQNLPLKAVAARESQIHLHSEKLKLNLEIEDLALRAHNGGGELNLELQTGESKLAWSKLSTTWNLGLDADLTRAGIHIGKLKFASAKQNLDLEGQIEDLPNLLKAPKGILSFTASSDLTELSSLLSGFANIPALSGEAEFVAKAELRGLNLPAAEVNLLGKEVKVADAVIGSFATSGKFNGERLDLPKIELIHPAGKAIVEDLRLVLETESGKIVPQSMNIKGKVKTANLDLHSLLQNIGVGDLPLNVQIGTELDCGGPILPRPNLVCVGRATGKELYVNLEDDDVTPPKVRPLVELAEFSAEGGLQITHEAVTYQAKAKVGSDTGESSGMISFEKGFLIQYETPSVRLDHIKEIAGLKIEGVAGIKGSTAGDSHAATFEMNVKGQDIGFEDFMLGEPSGKIRYKSGQLFFEDIVGNINKSPYRANVTADLIKSRIKVVGNSPNLQVNDLLEVLNRKFTMPVSLTGLASVQAEVEGPFELGKLSYHLQAKLPHLEVATESFTDGDVEIRSVKGNVKVEKAVFRKGSQTISATGSADPHGMVQLDLVGNQLLLEESENVSRLGSNISGFLDVGLQIKGFILKPDVSVQLQLGQMIIEDQEFPPSAASFAVNEKQIEGSVRLFAGRLFGDFLFPFNENSPFRMKMQASDWNFATMATLLGGGNLLSEYESSLSGELNIGSDKGGFWKASGKATINQMTLRRGNQTLKNPRPMIMTMNQGQVSLQDWRLEGGRDWVEVASQSFSKESLKMKIDAQISLRVLQIFVPFLEELGGDAKMNVAVSGPLLRPEILGTANLSEGFAKLRGFPHPLERTSANVQFSASRIAITDIRGSMAGGTVSGDGSILLLGPRNIPVNIRAQAQGITLHVPDKVETSGDADLLFSGSWFPFTLSGTYRVTNGLFSKELESGDSNQRVQQSSYLPQVIQQSAFEPVLLDLQVELLRPLTLKNSMIDGKATGTITIKGPPTNPVLGGQINIPSGAKVTFRDKQFEITSANLKFNDPKEMNPELFVSARARIQEYDINMVVQGTAKAPVLRLSSTPPLSENDIITLLALGVTSQKLEKQISNRSQESSSSYEIGTAILQNLPAAKSLQDTLGLNFQFSSGYDDTKNVAVQKITVSRQISEKVNAAVSSVRSEQNSTEAKVQYFFNPNFSAIGSWEGRDRAEGATLSTQEGSSESIFGLDLEFKMEFK